MAEWRFYKTCGECTPRGQLGYHHWWMVGQGHGPHASMMPWCKAWAYDAKMHGTSGVGMRIWSWAIGWRGTVADVEWKATWQTTWPIEDPGWRSSPGRDGFTRPQAGCEPCRFADSFSSSNIALSSLDPHNGVNTIGLGNVRVKFSFLHVGLLRFKGGWNKNCWPF